MLPLFMIATLPAVIVYRRTRISSRMKQKTKETDKKRGFAGDISTLPRNKLISVFS